MPHILARYWDSLDGEPLSANTLMGSSSEVRACVDSCQREWLSQLSVCTEHECQSILYAKSLLDAPKEKDSDPTAHENKGVLVPIRSQSAQLSSSTGNLVPPPKPQRRLARLWASNNQTIVCEASSVPSYSTLDLIDSCKYDPQTSSKTQKGTGRKNIIASTYVTSTEPSTPTNKWTPPGFRARRESTVLELSGSTSTLDKPPLPSYQQLKITRGKGSRKEDSRTRLRHTVAVNLDDLQLAKAKPHNEKSSTPAERIQRAPGSPKSMHSDSTLSVDSGQCSGDVGLTSQHSFSSSREEKDGESSMGIYATYHSHCLPGYPRMASTMDHVLRTSSAIFSLLSSTNSQRDLVAKTQVLVHILEACPCAQNIPKHDFNVVKLQLNEMNTTHYDTEDSQRPVAPVPNYFSIVVRKFVEQVLHIFAKIISRYLCECGSRDRLVVVALEHLIHVSLFGDELCLETIHNGSLTSVLKLLRGAGCPQETQRLLLRAMAVLCGVAKGSLSLLSLDGLEVVIAQLHSSSVPCAIEAAGILTQLTNPQHSFVQLANVDAILIRLLELVDAASTGESLLLVAAALANVSLQQPQAVDVLYRHNAIVRLINAYNKEECSTIFVQEQLITVLSRLAARKYEEALIAQGAVPVMLEMLTVTNQLHADYCRRIRYKAAVCIGTMAATGIGLKALYNHQAYAILCNVLEMENCAANPINMICNGIKTKLEVTYHNESAV